MPAPTDTLPGGLAATRRLAIGTVRKSPPLGVVGGPVAVSLRLSCHMTCSRPAFASMSVKNWWPLACVGVTRVGPVHVVPLSERAKKDRKSTRLNSSHPSISYAVFCLKKKKDEN